MTSSRFGDRYARRSWRGTVIGAALAVLVVAVAGPALGQDVGPDADKPDERAQAALEATLDLAPDAPPAADDVFVRLVDSQEAMTEAALSVYAATVESRAADVSAVEAAVVAADAREFSELTASRRDLAKIRVSVEKSRMSELTVRAYVTAGDDDLEEFGSLLEGDTTDRAGGQQLMFSQVIARQEEVTNAATANLTTVKTQLLVARSAQRVVEEDLAAALDVARQRTEERVAAEEAFTEAQASVEQAKVAVSSARRGTQVPLETALIGLPRLSAEDLASWFERSSYRPRVATPIADLAAWFIEEGAAEGIRGDVAFAQAILETGGFTNNDSVRANNYAGIGHCDSCPTGWTFPSPQMGVRAQIQLLKSYAVARPDYVHDMVDRRLRGPAGCCQTWNDLTTVWATDPGYGPKVMLLYSLMVDHALERRASGLGFDDQE
ncbi:MAG: glucosaminidase domain-containing protein [Aquihabitans sp.]